MSLEQNDISRLTQYIKLPFKPNNINILISFLKEIYTNIFKRSNRNFNPYTFQELFNLPMVITDKIYSILVNNSNKQINKKQFANGIFDLLYGDLPNKFNNTFKIFSFEDSNTVNKSDVFLILSHFHLIQNTDETIPLLEKMINEFFKNEEKLNKETYFSICRNANCDIALLLLIYINKYFFFFDEEELSYYESVSTNSLNTKSASISNNGKLMKENFSLLENRHYKPTMNLVEYINNVTIENLNNRDYGSSMDELSSFSDSDDELDELNNFENDVSNLFHEINKLNYTIDKNTPKIEIVITAAKNCINNNKGGAYENSKYNSNFNINYNSNVRSNLLMINNNNDDKKTASDNSCAVKNNEFKKDRTFIPSNNMKLTTKDTINKKSLFIASTKHFENSLKPNNKTKETLTSSFFDDTNNHSNFQPFNFNNNTNNLTIKDNKNFLAKAVTDFGGNVFTMKHKRNELYLYKAKENTNENKYVKLVIINKCIFYFKLESNSNKYNLKKVIPVISLFPKLNSVGAITKFYLISTVHNYYKKYCFFGENEIDIENFVKIFNYNSRLRKITDIYDFKYDLGKGKFGSVLLAHKKKNNTDESQLYAVKIVNKNNPTDEEYKINRWETTIFSLLANINHPNIIKCYEKFENDKNIFFVYEYVKGGDLKMYCKIKNKGTFKRIVNISLQILRGISCLHKYGIIHRDIKTTNILIQNPHENINELTDDNVKIIDFGLSRVLHRNEMSQDPYGSLCFKAPELIKHIPYSFKVDVWAIGVTVYYLLFKELPFEKGNKQQIKDSIVNENVNFPILEASEQENTDEQVGDDAFLYALIGDCLEKNVEQRPNIVKLIDKYADRCQDEL